MSNVSGSIAVNVEFRDSTTSSGVQSLKTIALRDTTEYTTGKVAIVTGTAGTAQTVIAVDNVYKNAAGEQVSIGEASRILFSWSRANARRLELIDFDDFAFCTLASRNSEVASCSATAISQLRLSASSQNTGTYTIVLYGT